MIDILGYLVYIVYIELGDSREGEEQKMDKCKHEWRLGVNQFPVAGGRYTAYEQYCRKCGVTEYVTPGMDPTDEEIARRRANRSKPMNVAGAD
jgi:hypothetical protein